MNPIQTIRAALESVMDTADWGACQKALAALAELERKDALLRQALCALGEGDCLLNHEAQKALVVEILKELQ